MSFNFTCRRLSLLAAITVPFSVFALESPPVPVRRLRGQANNTASLLQFEEESLDLGNWSRAVTAHRTGNSSMNNATQAAEPKMFFLFLTYSGIKRVDLWQAFFDLQPAHRYRIFAHCKHSNICQLELSHGNPLGATQVATVPTAYCKDLVSAMVQLLRGAIVESYSPNDKFIFLSETTLPAKPFVEVYSSLTRDMNSDFCVYPTDHWVELALAQNLRALSVKHSQWVVLNQAHAKMMVQRWPGVSKGLQGQSWSIPVYHEPTKGPYGQITNPAGKVPLPNCIDEWAFFATIYGAFIDRGEKSVSQEALPGFGPGPLQLRGAAHLTSTTQGICRTFAFWDTSEYGDSNLVNEIGQDWPWTQLSCFPKCDSTHPAEFTAISDRTAVALRRSRYLFARKFPENVLTMDQFKNIILSPPAPAAPPAQSAR